MPPQSAPLSTSALPPLNATLLQRLTLLSNPTAGEQTLMAYCEQRYPQLAFDNLEKISLNAGVSKASVTRFVRRLGYTNFHDFFRALRAEVAQNFDGGPNERYPATLDKREQTLSDCLHLHVTESVSNLQRTLEQVEPEHFDAIVKLLSDPARPLYLMGIATGGAILSYFALLLKYFRNQVILLDGDTATLAHRLVDVDKRCVLLTLAIDRNSTTVRAVMRHFGKLGCETILITNRRSSIFLQHTRYPLFISAEGTSIFRTRSSALVLLESLLSAIAVTQKHTIDRRFEAMAAISQDLNVFVHK